MRVEVLVGQHTVSTHLNISVPSVMNGERERSKKWPAKRLEREHIVVSK